MTDQEYSGLVLGLDEADYHAHRSLSSTGAKLLLDSPAAYDYVVRQGNRTEKKAFDVGSAAHALVLGTGYEVAVIPDELLSGANKSIASAAAKQWVADAREAGQIPLKESEFEPIRQVADAVLTHPMGRALLERPGNAEASVFATDPVTGVEMRCRFDFLPDDRKVAVDLKTGRKGNARPAKFAMVIDDLMYHVSWAHYLLTAELAGEAVTDMVFLMVETEPPFHITVGQLDADYKEIGRRRARDARERFARALETGEWPGYSSQIQLLKPPMRTIYEYQDAYES